MTQTLAALLPLLMLLAGPGAGIATSFLFAFLRVRMPQPKAAPVARWRRCLLILLYASFWARISVFLCAFVLGLAAKASVAWIVGDPVAPTVDAAIAGLISIVASQVTHALTDLSAQPTLATAAIQFGFSTALIQRSDGSVTHVDDPRLFALLGGQPLMIDKVRPTGVYAGIAQRDSFTARRNKGWR